MSCYSENGHGGVTLNGKFAALMEPDTNGNSSSAFFFFVLPQQQQPQPVAAQPAPPARKGKRRAADEGGAGQFPEHKGARPTHHHDHAVALDVVKLPSKTLLYLAHRPQQRERAEAAPEQRLAWLDHT